MLKLRDMGLGVHFIWLKNASFKYVKDEINWQIKLFVYILYFLLYFLLRLKRKFYISEISMDYFLSNINYFSTSKIICWYAPISGLVFLSTSKISLENNVVFALFIASDSSPIIKSFFWGSLKCDFPFKIIFW